MTYRHIYIYIVSISIEICFKHSVLILASFMSLKSKPDMGIVYMMPSPIQEGFSIKGDSKKGPILVRSLNPKP